jgi:hypothetical protein
MEQLTRWETYQGSISSGPNLHLSIFPMADALDIANSAHMMPQRHARLL